MASKEKVILCVCLAIAGCSTSWKSAPTTRRSDEHAAKVSEHVSKAQIITKSNRSATVEVFNALNSSKVTATSVVTDIDAAVKALNLKNYPKVAEALTRARYGEGMLLDQFTAMQRTVKVLIDGNDTLMTELNLAYAETDKVKDENRQLQLQIDDVVRAGAKAQAIVDRVNSMFGLGAIFYGVQRILTFGIIGIAIGSILLFVLVIALYLIGGPAWALFLRLVSKLMNRYAK